MAKPRGKSAAKPRKQSASKKAPGNSNGDFIDMKQLWREATRASARNKVLIDAGETFRAGAKSGKERSPGQNRDGLHS